MSNIKQFLIGSSYPITLFFFISVMNISDTIKNYSYQKYTIIAPLYIGLMNVIAYNTSYELISIISPLIVFIFAYYTKSYNFTKSEWLFYFFRLLFNHFVLFYFILRNNIKL